MSTQPNENNEHLLKRKGFSIAHHANWVWLGFSSTNGLERYRAEERYAAWRFVHRQLLQADPQYLAECRLFYAQLIMSVSFGAAILTLAQPGLHPVFAFPLSFVGMVAAMLWVFVREQRRRNEAIGKRMAADRH